MVRSAALSEIVSEIVNLKMEVNYSILTGQGWYSWGLSARVQPAQPYSTSRGTFTSQQNRFCIPSLCVTQATKAPRWN